MKLTPALLLKIADGLNGDTEGDSAGEYICASRRVPSKCLEDLQGLLVEGGMEEMSGWLVDRCAPWNRKNWVYSRDAMPVRFMFLEFLSYYLEDQE